MQASPALRRLYPPAIIALGCLLAAAIAFAGVLGSAATVGALTYLTMLVASAVVWPVGVPLLLIVSAIDGFVKHASASSLTYLLKDVLLAVIVVGVLLQLAVHRERYLKERWRGFVPWALFVGFMATQIAHPALGFSGAFAGFRAHGLFALLYIVGAVYFASGRRLIPVANLVIVMCAIAAAAGVIESALGSTWMNLGPGFAAESRHAVTYLSPRAAAGLEPNATFAYRAYGTLVDPEALGLFCSVGILFALAALGRARRLLRLVLCALIALMAVALFDSGTRSAMLGLGAGLIAMAVFSLGDKRTRAVALVGVLVLGLTVPLVLLTTHAALIERIGNGPTTTMAAVTRSRSSSVVLSDLTEYPLGHGLGATNAGGLLREDNGGLGVDNEYLAYAFETGVIGLLLFLLVQGAFLFLGIRAAMAKTANHTVFLGFVAAQCALLASAFLTQGAFDYAPVAQIFWLFCGALALPQALEVKPSTR